MNSLHKCGFSTKDSNGTFDVTFLYGSVKFAQLRKLIAHWSKADF